MKAMQPDSRIFAVRSLNEVRKLHPPTYVALRYLLDSITSDPNSSWVYKTISRKFPFQKTPRFFPYVRFKKYLENGEREYRHYLAPSPLTCLAEALVIAAMSGEKAFEKSASVYSNLWPSSSRCTYNYEHYYNGYQRRNSDIAKALKENPKSVALVADVEQFYPSIAHDNIRKLFLERMDASSIEEEIKGVAFRLFEHLVATFPCGKGIATGPELSYIIGDIALSKIDQELDSRYGGKYFRYVDDIVIVIDRSKKQEAERLLENLLNANKLRSNRDKSDVVSCDEWLAHGPKPRGLVTEMSFEALVFRLKVFLAVKPDKYCSLESALHDEGICLPLDRIRCAAHKVPFREKLKLYCSRGWGVLYRALRDSEKSLVKSALVARMTTKKHLTSILELEIPKAPTRRRWHVQSIRHLVNRMFYLDTAPELGHIRNALTNVPEFAETIALLKMLQDGDNSDLLEMPGAAVAAGAALLKTAPYCQQSITLPVVLSNAAVHSAGIFLLYGAAQLSNEHIQNTSSDVTDYLSFCSGRCPNQRHRDDFSYLDEILCLQLNRRAEDRVQLLSERFSDGEESVFEALDIGNQYYE